VQEFLSDDEAIDHAAYDSGRIVARNGFVKLIHANEIKAGAAAN
jgi:hypothetical protein